MPDATRPNILLIYADQHRADCLESAGHPVVQTPSLSRLANEGVVFRQAYTSTPTCCPARQSLMCGQWAEKHGGLWNFDLGLPLAPFEAPTWSQSLAEAGYCMTHVGKWHVHPTRTPLDYGYERYVPLSQYAPWRQAQGLPGYEPRLDEAVAARLHPSTRSFWGGRDPAPLDQTQTHWAAQQAIAAIQEYGASGQPWHVRLNLNDPHLPNYPADPFFGRYAPETLAPWPSFSDQFVGKPYIQRQQLASWRIDHLSWVEMAPYVARYLEMISQIDDAVGRVLDALDALGLAQSTLVIYSCDHGGLEGSHRMIDKHMVLYDDVVRVPLLMRGPGVVGGRAIDQFVTATIDMAPTLCELAGVPAPEGCQGRSLAPLLAGNVPSDWPDDVVATYNGNQFGLYLQRMLRTRDWKYIWNPTSEDELYDLEQDPWELINLIGEPSCQPVLADLRRRLLLRLQEHGDATVRTTWMQSQLADGTKLAK
jgi:arylsulfatase A-like enzyme